MKLSLSDFDSATKSKNNAHISHMSISDAHGFSANVHYEDLDSFVEAANRYCSTEDDIKLFPKDEKTSGFYCFDVEIGPIRVGVFSPSFLDNVSYDTLREKGLCIAQMNLLTTSGI